MGLLLILFLTLSHAGLSAMQHSCIVPHISMNLLLGIEKLSMSGLK